MVEVIQNSVRKARKEYYDDGWDIIQEWISEGCPVYDNNYKKAEHITFAEGRYLVGIKRREVTPHKILPGQTYRYQFNKMDGETYYWRTKEEFYKLLCKYQLFPDY